MQKFFKPCFFIGFFICWMLNPSVMIADYSQELRDQIKSLEARFAKNLNLDYFHDMGIIALKADESESNDLTTEIVQSLLLKKMESYISDEIQRMNQLYETDAYAASKRLANLNRYERFYKPTEDYQRTTAGQVISAELARLRKEALAGLKQACPDHAVLQGLQALRETGLFITNHPEEINSIREIEVALDCCMSWKSKINYADEKQFESEYEEGDLKQETHLTLETDRRNYSEAKWVGEWIYHFKGREGTGEGVSQATLRYQKGQDSAELVISGAKISSVGRMNFPVSLSGERRDVSIEGQRIFPQADFSTNVIIPLTGCHENTIVKETKKTSHAKTV